MKPRHAAALALVIAFGCLAPGCARHVRRPSSNQPPFQWYTTSVIDAMNKAWNNFLKFLSSKCDGVNGHCGHDTWTDIIRNTPLPNLTAGSYVTNTGFGDNGSDPTIEILTVDLVCPSGNCGMSGRTLTSYVTNQILRNVNSVGYSVQSAMQSFGLPIQVTINVNPPAQHFFGRSALGTIGHSYPKIRTPAAEVGQYPWAALSCLSAPEQINITVCGGVVVQPARSAKTSAKNSGRSIQTSIFSRIITNS